MIIGNKTLDTNKCYVMGILNVTPDSFYDGSRYSDIDRALAHAEQMIRDGADIIDVGGESTRPGFTPVPVQEEIERVVPVIEAIKKYFDVPVSLDTYKAETALAGIKAGADMINDIGGLRMDPDMASVIADNSVACCIMHNDNIEGQANKMEKVCSWLYDSVNMAVSAGVANERIVLDPGIGFGKGTEGDYELMRNLCQLHALGYPILLGVSRKSLIGNVLDVPKEERLAGTIAINTVGIMDGVSIIRVHDVKEHAQVVKILNLIKRRNRYGSD